MNDMHRIPTQMNGRSINGRHRQEAAPAPRPPFAIVFEATFVTPEMAAKMLLQNDQNRTPRSSHVEVMAADMRDGCFPLTHQAIALAPNGTIVDGQHRLMAIVESGVGQWIYIAIYETAVGATEAMACIDIGAKRDGGDQAELCGSLKKPGRDRIATARAVLAIEHGRARFSIRAAVERAAELSDDFDAIRSVMTRVRSTGLSAIAVAPFIWMHSVLSTKEAAMVADIGSRISSGEGMSPAEASIAAFLRRGLGNNGGSEERMALSIKVTRAIEIILDGGAVTKLQAVDRESLVERLTKRRSR